MTGRAPLSVIILTYNEETNIRKALESVKDWIGEIVIVDSNSTDATVEICREYTDRIYQHRFEGQGKQFNWALDEVPIAHEWVMRLDADEKVTPELARELCAALRTAEADVTAMYMKRRVHFMGRWMRHGGYYPRWFLRVFRKDCGRYEEIISGEHVVLARGRSIALRHDFVDHNLKPLAFWIDKHANWAAAELLQDTGIVSSASGLIRSSLLGSQEKRVRWLRQNVYDRLPLVWRGFAYFLYRYFLRLGFLDGTQGLIFHFLQACWFRVYCDAKIYEARTVGAAAFAGGRYGTRGTWKAVETHVQRGETGAPRTASPAPLAARHEAREKAPVSVVILTYNEAENIGACLESVAGWAAEIVIVDSYSTDATLEVCRRYTGRIYQHPFENQAKQFNWALDALDIRSPWVLRLDADEFVTTELAAEICETVRGLPEEITGLYLRRRVYFMGRWMRHGGYYPKWFIRLFRRGAGRYEDVTEEHVVLGRGRAVRLRHDFVDYNRKGLTFWTDKHNHWAIGEMVDTLSVMGDGDLPEGTVTPALFGTQEQRIRWLKEHVYARCPMFVRAFAYFAYRYVVRLGVLDGKEGLIFHFLQGCWYRFLVDAKIYEVRLKGVSREEPIAEYSGARLRRR